MNDLTKTFDEARKEPSDETIEQLRQHYFIRALMRDSDAPTIGGLNINKSGRKDTFVSTGQGGDKAAADAYFLALLDDMRLHLADLVANMAVLHDKLQDKYGEDVISGIAATYLTEEELAGLETDEQKLNTLAKKLLNPDGTIKDKYKYLDEAKYIQAWQEAQTLKVTLAKYEGRQTLEPEEKIDVYQMAKNTSLAENKNMMALSSNNDFQKTLDTTLDNNANEIAVADSVGNLGFK